jgi:hypothetical protein
MGQKPASKTTMPHAEPELNREQLARLGPDAFNRHVRPRLRPEDDGKFAAVDIRTGDFELDEDDDAAVARLRTRRPSAEVWLERVGQPAAYRMRCGR